MADLQDLRKKEAVLAKEANEIEKMLTPEIIRELNQLADRINVMRGNRVADSNPMTENALKLRKEKMDLLGMVVTKMGDFAKMINLKDREIVSEKDKASKAHKQLSIQVRDAKQAAEMEKMKEFRKAPPPFPARPSDDIAYDTQ